MSERERLEKLEREIAELRSRNESLQNELAVRPATHTRSFDWRRFGTLAFLFLGLVAIIPAGLLIWLDRTLMNQEHYIETVGPVIQQPEVQQAITKNASDALFSNVNVDAKVSEALPPEAQFLTPAISSQVKTQMTNLIGGIVASDRFHNVWVATNKKAQSAFVKLAQSDRASPEINIDDVYGFISEQMQDTKLAPLLNKQLPQNIGSIQVANVPALEKVPQFAAKLDAWRWALVLLAIVMAALAIWTSRNRRKTVLQVGILLIVASVISLVLIRIGRGLMLSKIANPENHAAAIAIWQTVLQNFYVQMSVTVVIGLAIIVVGWVLGPGRLAVRLRTSSTEGLGALRSRFFPVPGEVPAIVYMQKYRRVFEWALLALTVLVLLALTPLTVASAVIILAVALLVLLVIEFAAVPEIKPKKKA